MTFRVQGSVASQEFKFCLLLRDLACVDACADLYLLKKDVA